jgi:hypothetical protein
MCHERFPLDPHLHLCLPGVRGLSLSVERWLRHPLTR